MNIVSIEEAVRQLAQLFAGRSLEQRKALLAALERSGAAVYRAMAEEESDPAVREGHLQAAAREEENASFLEGE